MTTLQPTELAINGGQPLSKEPILIHKPGPLFDESPARQAAIAGVYRRGLEEVGALLRGVRTQPG